MSQPIIPPRPFRHKPVVPSTKIKFTPDGYVHAFLLARAVFNTRFTSKKWKRNAALLMYMCEDALGAPQLIPPKCLERFPRAEFKSELNSHG